MEEKSKKKKRNLISKASFLILIATILLIAFISTSMFFSSAIIYSIILIDILLIVIAIITWLLLKDMEEHRATEKIAVELNKRIQVTNKMLRHDILGKLAVVRGELELSDLLGNNQFVDDAYENLKAAIQIVYKMKQLEQALSIRASLKVYFVEQIIEKACNEQNIKLAINGNAQVYADEAIYSIFENLIQNAKVHGGVDSIDVSIVATDKNVIIKVADDGVGIDSEKMKERIFDEGVKGGKTGNTGLGLYIVSKTVERYGGSIRFEDNFPKGSVFVISLPKNQMNVVL